MIVNKREKEILQLQLNNEKKTLNELKQIYKKALDDIDDNIAALQGRMDLENLQSIVYQVDYQTALKAQVEGILDELNTKQFNSISEYLTKCYEDGFVGAMYNIYGQGVPLIIMIDHEQVVRALQTESKLSKSLYETLGEDVNLLKKRVSSNISRGIAQGSSYYEISKNIAAGMVGDYSKMRGGALSRAMTITRTEGHRISTASAHDAAVKSKEAGADVVKQWDAALDRRTRPHHSQLDGQIREIDEPFEIAGRKAMYPGGFGVASEDINCRCVSLTRARWALDEDELQELKDRAEYFGLDKTENFEDFKQKYLDISKNASYNDSVSKPVYDGKIKADGTNKTSDKEVRNKNSADSGKTASETSIVKDAIASGVVSAIINTDKQSKHIKDSVGYIEGRSYIYGTLEDAQKLVDDLSGTGSPLLDSEGNWTNKERVQANTVIGVHINPETNKKTETNKATIVYSKTGSHVYPRKDDDK